MEVDEGSYLPDCQSNLVIALHALSLFFCKFTNTTAHLWAYMSLHLPLAVALPARTNAFKHQPFLDGYGMPSV